MSIIFCDTETTGLLEADGNLLDNQPSIIEIALIKTDDNLVEIERFETFLRPPKPIPGFITKITGIDNHDVSDAPEFHEVYRDIAGIFFGCHTFVAHNLTFDLGLIVNELARLKKTYNFPYPPIHYCTVEHSFHINGYRMKLSELYELATGKSEIKGAHRAMNDTEALVECYKYLKEIE